MKKIIMFAYANEANAAKIICNTLHDQDRQENIGNQPTFFGC